MNFRLEQEARERLCNTKHSGYAEARKYIEYNQCKTCTYNFEATCDEVERPDMVKPYKKHSQLLTTIK